MFNEHLKLLIKSLRNKILCCQSKIEKSYNYINVKSSIKLALFRFTNQFLLFLNFD